MATTIDQKVVEIQFDNRDFEKNTKQTMSTLDKLKEKLHFKGASDGLEEISKAAKKVNMNGLADGIQTVSAKFSAMEVIGTTALVNLTNSAINAGKQIVKSISIDQVTAGMTKMEEKISSVQTLVNSTGKSVEEIEDYLDALMWYSDETSYGFTDMTKALANMTSTGGNIDKLIPMIRGMANATAFAGKNAADFSRVIYNLNQSYGAGYLQLMDWKSVQLAGVNSKQLTEELIKAGEALGTIKKGQVTIGNFNETLKDKWATTAVMEKAFGRFDEFSQAVYERHLETGEQASVIIRQLAKDYDELAVKAFRSAQEAKSFSEAIDATKDASSTAWMTIFSTILGNYEDQKQIFSTFTEWLYNHFVDPIYEAQQVIEDAFNLKKLKAIFDKITNNPIEQAITDINKKVKGSTHTLEEYQKMVKRIWRGDFKSAPYRKALVEAEGYNYAVTQSLVNLTDEIAGYGKGWTVINRITEQDVIRLEKKYGITVEEVTDSITGETKAVASLTDERLKAAGLSEDEIDYYRRMEKGAAKYGLSIDQLIKKMEEEGDARSLIFGKKKLDERGMTIMDPETGGDVYEVMGIFQNMAAFFSNIFAVIKKAWKATFEEMFGVDIYMAISRLNAFTVKLKEMTDNADSQGMKNLTDTFRGLFGILKLITTLVGGGFKIAWTIFKTVLETLGYDVLDFTGAVGRLVATFTDFVTKNSYVTKTIVFLTKMISKAIISVHNFIASFISLNGILEKVQNVLSKVAGWIKKVGKAGLKTFVKDLQTFFEGLKNTDNIPKYIFESLIKGISKYAGKLWAAIQSLKDKIADKLNIEKGQNFFEFGLNCVKGLINGVKSGAGKGIKAFAEWASNILKTFAEKLGIHSPSTEFFAFGGNIVQGLYNGIASTIGLVYELIKTIGGKLIDIVKNLDLGSLLAALVSAGAVFGIVQIAKALSVLSDGLQNVNAVIGQAAGVLKSFRGVLKAFKVKIITSALKDVATSIAILVGSIVVLTLLDVGKVWASIGAIAAMIALMAGLVAVAGKFGKKEALDFGKLALALLAVGISMGLMASAFRKIAKLKDISWGAIGVFTLMITGLIALAYTMGHAEKQMVKMGGALLAVGAALLLMSMVVKKLGKMKTNELIQGTIAIAVFGGMIVGLMAATKLLTGSSNVGKIGSALLGVAVCFVLMASVVKKLGKMDSAQLRQGTIALAAFEAMIIGLMAATRLLTGSKNVAAIGATLASVGAAILMMGITAKMLGKIPLRNLIQGEIAVAAFMAMIVGLIYGIKKIGGKDINNINKTLFGVAACIAVMSLSAALLGMMSLGNLVKGVAAVGLLTLFVIGLIRATEHAQNLGKSLIPLAVAIGVLALSVGLLSIIDPKRLVGPTLALGLLMTLFGLMVKLATSVSSNKSSLGSLIVMVVAIGVLAGALALLAGIKNSDNVLGIAVGIAAVFLALSVSLALLGKMNMGTILQGLVGLLAITGVLYLVIGAIALLSKVQNAEANIGALTAFMGAMLIMMVGVAALGILYSATGGMAMLGLVGLLAIVAFMYSLVGVLALLGKIENAEQNIVMLTNLMNCMTALLIPLAVLGPLAAIGVAALYALVALMPVLILFATGIGALVEYLPSLETFMNKGMQLLISLAGGLGEMIGAFVNGALTKISSGLPEIGKNLSSFMMNTLPFIAGCNLVTSQTLKGVSILTLAILELTAAEFINGIANFLSGGNNFAKLGTELSEFAINAMPFIAIASTIPKGAMDGIKSLASAILTLTAANVLDGLAKFFGGGSTSLAEFGNALPGLGEKLSEFVGKLGVFTTEQVTTVKCAGEAIKALADAANKLPKKDGLWQKIFGQASLSEFAENMPVVAEGVVGFVGKLGEFSNPQIETAKCACEVIKALAAAADSLPKKNGLWQKIFGSDGLKDFADDMPSVAEGVKGFIDKLKGYEDYADVATSAGNIIGGIANLSKIDYDKFPTDKIKTTLPAIGEGMASFVSKLKSITEEDVKSTNNKLSILTNAVKTLVDTINNSFEDNTGSIITTVDGIAKKASAAFASKTIIDDLRKVQGKNFVKGFADGLNDNSSIAENAAKSIAQKALNASKKTLDEHSPSKETEKQGKYFGEGFVIGIEKYSTKIYDVSTSVGNEAKRGLSAAISKISNLVESGIDSRPTIRPVLDLTDVANSAGYINSMLGNPSMQLAANLNSISSGMNGRIQNGNSDVVSAIDKLGKNLGTTRGDTYNINGITYSDDNNINRAVQELVRAIEIERRI